MNNVTVGVSVSVDSVISRLNLKDKIKLTRKLEKITMGKRIDNMLKRIDARCKKNPISEKEISEIIKETRKELYG